MVTGSLGIKRSECCDERHPHAQDGWHELSLRLGRRRLADCRSASTLLLLGPIGASTSSGSNLCSHGKLLPQLYVLGQKTATTSFRHYVTRSGVLNSCSSTNRLKECNFFNSVPIDADTGALRGGWLDKLRPCPRRGRQVAADFTTSYCALVPLPDYARHTNSTFQLRPAMASVPNVLHRMYGDVAARNITFVVLLREPLARMQSAWYHAKAGAVVWGYVYPSFSRVCNDCRGPSFRDSLRRSLDKARRTPRVIEDWLWMSMYAHHLRAWLRYFQVRQFYIVPIQQFVRTERFTICREMSKRLGLELDCFGAAQASAHLNTHVHPALSEDLSLGLRETFQRAMVPEVTALVELLAQAHAEGATLAGYEGAGGPASVRAWLEANW